MNNNYEPQRDYSKYAPKSEAEVERDYSKYAPKEGDVDPRDNPDYWEKKYAHATKPEKPDGGDSGVNTLVLANSAERRAIRGDDVAPKADNTSTLSMK